MYMCVYLYLYIYIYITAVRYSVSRNAWKLAPYYSNDIFDNESILLYILYITYLYILLRLYVIAFPQHLKVNSLLF